MHERNNTNLPVHVFLRMNTWIFETCRRHYNLIKTLMRNFVICWFLLHTLCHIARFKKRKINPNPSVKPNSIFFGTVWVQYSNKLQRRSSPPNFIQLCTLYESTTCGVTCYQQQSLNYHFPSYINKNEICTSLMPIPTALSLWCFLKRYITLCSYPCPAT
jgi:hypothetical protein